MPLYPDMKPARARRARDNNYRRRWRRRKTYFNLLYSNGYRLTGNNNAAGDTNDSKKINDTQKIFPTVHNSLLPS
jgi:hypothetical protein